MKHCLCKVYSENQPAGRSFLERNNKLMGSTALFVSLMTGVFVSYLKAETKQAAGTTSSIQVSAERIKSTEFKPGFATSEISDINQLYFALERDFGVTADKTDAASRLAAINRFLERVDFESKLRSHLNQMNRSLPHVRGSLAILEGIERRYQGRTFSLTRDQEWANDRKALIQMIYFQSSSSPSSGEPQNVDYFGNELALSLRATAFRHEALNSDTYDVKASYLDYPIFFKNSIMRRFALITKYSSSQMNNEWDPHHGDNVQLRLDNFTANYFLFNGPNQNVTFGTGINIGKKSPIVLREASKWVGIHEPYSSNKFYMGEIPLMMRLSNSSHTWWLDMYLFYSESRVENHESANRLGGFAELSGLLGKSNKYIQWQNNLAGYAYHENLTLLSKEDNSELEDDVLSAYGLEDINLDKITNQTQTRGNDLYGGSYYTTLTFKKLGTSLTGFVAYEQGEYPETGKLKGDHYKQGFLAYGGSANFLIFGPKASDGKTRPWFPLENSNWKLDFTAYYNRIDYFYWWQNLYRTEDFTGYIENFPEIDRYVKSEVGSPILYREDKWESNGNLQIGAYLRWTYSGLVTDNDEFSVRAQYEQSLIRPRPSGPNEAKFKNSEFEDGRYQFVIPSEYRIRVDYKIKNFSLF